ncbi:MAG: MBL fold metallo-hydrolase [Prevotella sp.]|nr:MBL fold metallo-hydrolase [Prevotella sp.]
MLRFISFGSGSSGNCYVLYTDTDGIMIDAGVGVRSLKKHLRDYGLSFSRIHSILITHDHADHIKSVGSISHDYHLPVYATQDVHDGIDRNYCVSRKVAFELRCTVQPDVPVQIGEFLVTPFSVPHDSSDNVGYQIEVGDEHFCIVTDVGHVTPVIAEHIRRADHLVIEANHDVEMLMQGPYPQHLKERISSGSGHLNNTACAHAIAQNMGSNLRHVWLCHLSEENNHPELARKTVEAILRSYGIVAGHDFQFEVLKRTMPTGVFDLSL